MIVGVGIDVVDIERFGQTIERTPRLLLTALHRGRASLAESLLWQRGSRPRRRWPSHSAHPAVWRGRTRRWCAGGTAGRTSSSLVRWRRGPTTSGSPRSICPCPTTPASRRPWSSPRAESRAGSSAGKVVVAVIEAYAVSDIRAAESAAMATVPDGELMSRAAHGLADVAAARLRERDGVRCVALVGPGNNGGDALYAASYLAQQGFAAASAGGLLGPRGSAGVGAGRGSRPARRLEPAWAFGAERRPTSSWTASSGSAVGPVCSAPGATWVDVVPAEAWVIAVDLPVGAGPCRGGGAGPGGLRRRDGDLRGGQAGARAPGDGTGRRAADGRRHRAGPATAYGRCRTARPPRTYGDCGRSRSRVDDKYSRGVVGIVAGACGRTPAPPVLCGPRRARGAGLGMLRYVGPPERLLSWCTTAVPEAVTARAGAGLGGGAGLRCSGRSEQVANKASDRSRPRGARSRPARRSWALEAHRLQSRGRPDRVAP